VATISDATKLKDQSFFVNAKNGDELLAYTKAMEAILYRPSINKIIAVAPIVINNNQTTAAPTTTDTSSTIQTPTTQPVTPTPTTPKHKK
jgi:predicted ABC-class ATPase